MRGTPTYARPRDHMRGTPTYVRPREREGLVPVSTNIYQGAGA